jgi:hypothetical protein
VVTGSAPVPWLQHGWVDGGYRGVFLGWARERRRITFQVVQSHDSRRGQLAKHVHYVLAVCGQLLGEHAAQAAGALHRPAPRGPALGPAAQRTQANPGGGEALLVNQVAALIQYGRSVAGLVGSTAMITPIPRPPWWTHRGTKEDNPTWSGAVL